MSNLRVCYAICVTMATIGLVTASPALAIGFGLDFDGAGFTWAGLI